MYKSPHRFNIVRAFVLGIAIIAIAVAISWKFFKREDVKIDSFHRIRERGYLIALTDQNTLNYFIYRGEPMGYQLELLESFAKYLGVPLRIIASNNINRLEYYLYYNAADLIALNIPLSRSGKKTIQYSLPFGETRLVLVQKKPTNKSIGQPGFVKSLKEFPADTVYLRSNPFLASMYRHFQKETRGKAILKETNNISQEELIRRVSKGIIHYTICQENVAMAFKRYFYNIDISIIAYPFSPIAGVNHDSDSLRMQIDAWLTTLRNQGDLKQVYLDYFDNQRLVRLIQSGYCSMNKNALSPYDGSIQKFSVALNWDWRLIASLIYEESNFRQGQISKYNASGLMQLMPKIAARFGIDSASSPASQISGGVKYLHYLDSQIPEEITNPLERVNFVLAAYNVGIGRVLAARERAGQYGRDKNRWNKHVDYYLLRRSKKEPQGIPDTLSFQVDYKTEGFVDDIISRYHHYRNLIH